MYGAHTLCGLRVDTSKELVLAVASLSLAIYFSKISQYFVCGLLGASNRI